VGVGGEGGGGGGEWWWGTDRKGRRDTKCVCVSIESASTNIIVREVNLKKNVCVCMKTATL